MRTRKNSINTNKRILWVALILVTWMMAIIWRLAWVQVVDHKYYYDRAARSQQREIEIVPTRGAILDRNGRELAYSLVSDSLYVDLKILSRDEDRHLAASLLAPLIGMNESELREKLTGQSSFKWLSRKLDPDRSQKVREAISTRKLNGIGIKKETQRVYPNDTLASHVLGFVGSEDQGLAGLEQVWDDLLRGKPGEMMLSVDARRVSFDRSEIPPLSGATINTTLDMSLQHKVEVLLDQAFRISRAKGVSAIVMQPDTGEIVALANAPSFDPNKRPAAHEMALRSNRAIGFPYEPGSVFKIVAYSAAIEEGIVSPSDKIDCGNGEIRFGKRVIHDTHAYGVLSVADAFAKSSNVGAIKLAQRVGKGKFFEYIERFGFGKRTGIELPGESRGIVNPLERWAADSIGSVAMGQEISVTLLQAASAMGTIANGGVRVQPHIISDIIVQGDRQVYKAAPKTEQVVSRETAAKMNDLLQRVVTDGTGRHAIQLTGYTAAGKTGTPQKVDGRTGAYSKSKYMPTFAGYVPAIKPRFVIIVMVDEPVGQYYGGIVAAPIFNLIAEAALGDYAVPPDDQGFRDALVKLSKKYENQGGGELEAGRQKHLSVKTPEAAERLAESSANLSPLRSVQIKGPRNKPGKESREAVVSSMAASFVMPDLRGRGVRSVAQACAELNLTPRLLGSGVAFRQSPQPGERIREGEECRVEFK